MEPDRPMTSRAFSPAGVSAYHWLSLAWPFSSPAFAWPMWRYSGRPARVSCFMPSERSTEPTRFFSTPIAWTESSAMTGIQIFAQSPVHMDLDGNAWPISWR